MYIVKYSRMYLHIYVKYSIYVCGNISRWVTYGLIKQPYDPAISRGFLSVLLMVVVNRQTADCVAVIICYIVGTIPCCIYTPLDYRVLLLSLLTTDWRTTASTTNNSTTATNNPHIWIDDEPFVLLSRMYKYVYMSFVRYVMVHGYTVGMLSDCDPVYDFIICVCFLWVCRMSMKSL